MIIFMNYNCLLKETNESITKILSDKFQDEIYGFSVSWRESKKYILKANGKYGDYIVDWE